MAFLPAQRMWERIERARGDSDMALFHDLLLFGELVLKATVAGLVASIDDEAHRHRYRQAHRLVRADGLGEWASVLEDLLTGPSANYLLPQAVPLARPLTQKLGHGNWQFTCALLLDECLRVGSARRDSLPLSVPGKRWLVDFVELRNKTRGHGAPNAQLALQLTKPLESAIRLFTDSFQLFEMPWAYLHQNLSGSYRVTKLTQPASSFDSLKRKDSPTFPDGVYLYLDKPRRVELLYSDPDHTDFFFPNGAFNGKRFELLSYITGQNMYADAAPYTAPAQELPPSATQGLLTLEVAGQGFSNVPRSPIDYIARPVLERELIRLLLDDRHPIVTLYGPGGIGKTSLALRALNSLPQTSPFSLVVWFSARDIELLPEGPKPVQPHVLTIDEIASEFVKLTAPQERTQKGFRAVDHLTSALSKTDTYGPTLFVFDNFETVRNLPDVYTFIDTYVRLPNKVLITTRLRDFKGDYPVEVQGMNEEEAAQLIDLVSRKLEIGGLVTDEYRHELLEESGGHPYVIKILLGEAAKAGAISKVRRVIASQEHVLTALFERTYQALSLVAKRVFLTLCSWRSMVPLLALKAVMFRPRNERMDVDAAVEELRRSSLIEIATAETDSQVFVDVPLSASEFGRQKAKVDPMKAAVESDCELLRAFGPTQETDLRHGLKPRMERVFRHVSEAMARSEKDAGEYVPVLEFLANSYPDAWLGLADLYEESATEGNYQRVKHAILNYIQRSEVPEGKTAAWERLGRTAHRADDSLTEIHANVEMCQDPRIPFWKVSDAANRVNSRLRERWAEVDRDEKRVLVQKLVNVMGARSDEGTADDLSRLAWLSLTLGNEDKAREYVAIGLERDGTNEHCLKLAERLDMFRGPER